MISLVGAWLLIAASAPAVELHDLGQLNPDAGDRVEAPTLYGTEAAAAFDGSNETRCTVRAGTAFVRTWPAPVTIAQIDVCSYYWPAEKPDNKWIYGYRLSIRDGEEWRLLGEFGGDAPLNPPVGRGPRLRSGRGYFAGCMRHDITTGGLPVVTTALRIEAAKAYKDRAFIEEIGILGLRRGLAEPELAQLASELQAQHAGRAPQPAPATAPAPEPAARLLLHEDAALPPAFADITPLLLTGAYAAAVTAVNPETPSLGRGRIGGRDAGLPGDGAAFRLSRMAIGKGYYRSNDAIKVALDTSELTGDVWLDLDFARSQYGTMRFDVLIDDGPRIARFDCSAKPYGAVRAGGLIPGDLLPRPRATITFREARAVYYAVIDSIEVRGRGLALIAKDGERLDADALKAKQEACTPQLPTALAAPPGWRGFDFGSDTGTAWTAGGCVSVSEAARYEAGRGFGWLPGAAPIRAGAVAAADVLRGDYHTCHAEAAAPETLCAFRVDLPNGRYHLMLVAGLAPFDAKSQKLCELALNGATRLRFPFFNRKDTLLGLQSVHHRFAEVEVSDRRLLLEWVDGDYMIINGLFVWPETVREAGRAAAMEIIERYYLPVAQEVKPGGSSQVPTAAADRKRLGITETRLESTTDKDRELPVEIAVPPEPAWGERGYALFQRPYDRPLYPYSVATAADRTKPPFRAAAALGEREPWQFGIRAERDLAALTVTVSAFRHAQNAAARIAADRIDVRRGHVIKESLTTTPSGQYIQIAKPLVPATPMSLPAHQTALYWITVHVPPDAVPGLYRAELNVSPGGGPPNAYELELNVRPFELKDPPVVQGMWWGAGYYAVNPEQMREAQFADMIAHGLRTIVLYCFDGAPEVSFTDGEAHFDYARVDETLAMLKRYGFLGPIPVYAPHARIKHALPEDVTLDDDLGRQALGAMVRGMIRKYAEYGFEVQFYPYDEPSASGPSFEAAQNLLKLYKAAAPEARTFCTAVLASATNLDEWLDTRCYCGLKDGWFEAAAKAGDEVWEYGGVYGSAANSSLRLKAGLANVRTGVRGKLYWVYCWPKGSAWFDLDNSGKETGAVVPSPDGPIPIVAYECLREGIDDARYFETLRVLAEARDSAPARTLLDEVMAKFNDIGHLQDEKTSLTELRETMARQIAVLSAP